MTETATHDLEDPIEDGFDDGFVDDLDDNPDDLDQLDQLDFEPSPWWRRSAWSVGIAALLLGGLVTWRQCPSDPPAQTVASASPQTGAAPVLAPSPMDVADESASPLDDAGESPDTAQCAGVEASLKQLQTERKGLLEATTRAAREREAALRAQAQAEQEADVCVKNQNTHNGALSQARAQIKALEAEVAALKQSQSQARPKELIDVIHAYDKARQPRAQGGR